MPIRRSSVAVLFILFASASIELRAQASAPIIDYSSLLNLRVYDNGSALFETVDVVFAPDLPPSASLQILDGDGRTLQRHVFFASYQTRDKAFGRLQMDGHALWQAPAPGNYALQIEIDGAVATRFPFTVLAVASPDAFDAAQELRFDGPWRELGYLQKRPYRDTELLDLVVWTGGLDLPGGAQRDLSIAWLRRGGETIGHSRETAGSIQDGHFRQSVYAFLAPHEARDAHEALPIARAELIDGQYEILLQRSSDGQAIRRFEFDVVGGEIQPDARGRLDFLPRDALLSPNVYRSGGNYTFQTAFWLRNTL